MRRAVLIPLAILVALPASVLAQSLPYVVSAAELRRTSSEVVLFHVGSEDGYREAHLPGARHLDLDMVSVEEDTDGLDLQLPPLADLARRWEALGVSSDSRVVLYWAGGWVTPTTRAWLTLDRLGLGERARILDGGLEAWRAAGGPVTADLPGQPRPGQIRPAAREVSVDRSWLAGHLEDAGVAVVDARAARFYDGSGAGSDPRPGHIPGARSAPYTGFMTEDNHFKPAAALDAMLTEAGAVAGTTVVTYCHIGQQATLAYFMARNLGREARLYDGSYQDWSRDWSLPVTQLKPVQFRLVPPAFAQRVVETPEWAFTVIDARSDLSAYLAGHLPRAVFLHNETLRSTGDGVPADLLPGESYRALFERLGVRLDVPVLVYGQGDNANFHATFVAWLLGALGHPNVALLDGGWSRWTAEGRPVTQAYPAVTAGDLSRAAFRPELATLDDVRRAQATGALLVDARPPAQFRGESGPQMRRGHIPGAINHTWSGDLRPDSAFTFKAAEALAESYRAQGITPDREVIVYCNTGTEASHLWFALRHVLGFERVRVYVPSWTEYVAHDDLPVATGG